MDRLASCYFCGAATDVSLAEYPVVPRELDPDPETRRTVVLCETCRRKFETVLEPVVEAAGPASGGQVTLGDAIGEGTDETPAAGDPEMSRASSTDAPGPSSTDAGGADDSDASVTAEPLGDVAGESGADTTGRERDDRTDDEDRGQAATDDVDPGDDAATTDPGMPGPDAPDRGDGGTTADREGAGKSDDAESITEDVTALEYNKVIRLLGNREFPVDRREFETVASSAYELRPGTVAKVVDAAIERGLVDERNGQLFEPDS